MSNLSNFSLTDLVKGIKKKDFTSLEITKTFVNNSENSTKLNTYITKCFDEAIIYAMRLMNAGVPVDLRNYPGTVHGFDYLIPCDISERAIRNEINMFKRAIHK